MSTTSKTVCDTCGRDLTYTTNDVDYRILLKSEAIPPNPSAGSVTAAWISPEIPHSLHFCNLRCLKSFVEKL